MDRCPYNECKYNYRVKKGRMKMAKPQNTITKATKIILQGILNSDEELVESNEGIFSIAEQLAKFDGENVKIVIEATEESFPNSIDFE